MAEVLPSSPHYATAEEGGGRYMREDRSNSNKNSNRNRSSSSSGEKISVSVRGRRDSGGGVSAVLNICKGETSGDDDDEDEDISQERRDEVSNNRNNGEEQPWILAVLLTTFRRSLVACKPNRGVEDRANMDISWPTNVRHVAHVTFDRFNGFLGLPVEFEMEIPRRAPSASASVFGVSAESMQLSYDSRGNSVPTILLLMQQRLYAQGGLKAEGIFRINAENSQEENVRDQLNKGIVPDDIDMHCLAGLIKAWFRELPSGVLDSLTPEQVLQCNDEKQCVELVQLLPPTQSALLNWAINLMTDVVQEELHNKMNARNIAMVFAPNMTQMADPLTALMHAVQVMNLLKTLILKTLREREESALGQWNSYCSDSNDDNDYGSTPQRYEISDAKDTADEDDHTSESPEYLMSGYCHSTDGDSANYSEEGFSTGIGEKDISDDEEDISQDSMFDRYYGSQFAYVEAKENKEIDRPRQSISYDNRKESRNFDRYSSRTALDKARGSFSVQMPDRATIYQFRKDSSMIALEGDQNKTSTSEQEIDFISVDTDEKNITYHIEDEKENSKEQSQHLVQMIQSAVKTKGRVVNTIDQQTERVEAW